MPADGTRVKCAHCNKLMAFEFKGIGEDPEYIKLRPTEQPKWYQFWIG